VSVIHWSVSCSVGTVIGPVTIEHEENGSSIAELTVQGNASVGSDISIGSSVGTLFTGVVDRAEKTEQGLVRLECTSGLQQAVNRLTRTQIDSLFTGNPWHSDLSDDESQGWDYFQDRLKTFLGSVNASAGVPQLVSWRSGGGGSPVIETSTNTPSYTTLLDGVIFEIEYRVPTYEQIFANYSWADRDTIPSENYPQAAGIDPRLLRQVEWHNQAKFKAARMTRGEVDQLLRSTGWMPASVDGESVAAWRSSSINLEAINHDSEGDDDRAAFSIMSANPITSFNATLVRRFESQLIIKGEMVIGNPDGNIKRVSISREHPSETSDGWKEQLGEPPEIDFRPDLNQWLNAHAAAARKEIEESHRQASVTVTTPLRRASISGSSMKVRHELDPEAGTALTSVTYSTYSHVPFTPLTATLDPIRERAEGPSHSLNTRVFNQNEAGEVPNEPGLIKTVSYTQYFTLQGGLWRVSSTWVNSVNKASFTMPAPEYDDTSPIEISMSVS